MPRQRKAGPSKRESGRVLQYQGVWLATLSNGVYYIHWYDPQAGRARRQTTGTRDLEEAKQKLIAAPQATPPDDPQNPAVVDISLVKRFYFEHHVTGIRDKDGPKRAFTHLLAYLASVGTEGKVADLTLARQDGFMRWCRDQHRLSNKTISTYLSYIKAGLRFCSRPRLIKDARGREREVQILSTPPHIDDSEDRVTKVTDLPKSEPREWVPTDAQLAAMFDAIGDAPDQEAMFRYMIMGLNTWARPEAITDLSVLQQVDFRLGIITLNPPGRVQNKKRRPRIRLTDNLRGWPLHWNLDRPITYYGRPVARVDNRTLKKIAKRAGIDPAHVNRYMLRHYMATRIRRVQSVPVRREERALWLGHADSKHKQTEWYEHFDPDYLEAPMRATNTILADLNRLCRRRSLIAPTVANATGLQLSVIPGSKTGTSEG